MARWAYALGFFGVSAAGALGVWACLPSLTPPASCGNGIIDLDAGETCDPGLPPRSNPGCSDICQIVCTSPAGASGDVSYYFDNSSNHCYFTGAGDTTTQSYDAAIATCESPSNEGHVVTLVDDNEAVFVVTSFFPQGDGRFWIGLAADGGVDVDSGPIPYFSAAASEPGWNPQLHTCYGCYLYGWDGGTLVEADGGAKAGLTSAIVDTHLGSHNGTMETMGQGARANVVCEREPVGVRSVPCGGDAGVPGSYCFGIPATTKRYLYDPNPETAANAEAACRAPPLNGSLVVFSTRREREQVIYEIGQLGTNGQRGVQVGQPFWIGLSYRVVMNDKGWFWDDDTVGTGTSRYPLVWGNAQPMGQSVGDYAFINLSPPSGYDVGLAYANGNSRQAYPFVCTY